MSAFAAWMRLDRPGRDAALLRPCDGGWVLQGEAAFDHEAGSAAVAYQVEVDARWRTKRGVVSGFLGDRTIQHEIRRDDAGWSLNGVGIEGLDHDVGKHARRRLVAGETHDMRGMIGRRSFEHGRA